jgi:hypothetical protein
MLVPVLSIQYYYFIIIFLPAASFLNAALCWSIKEGVDHLNCCEVRF